MNSSDNKKKERVLRLRNYMASKSSLECRDTILMDLKSKNSTLCLANYKWVLSHGSELTDTQPGFIRNFSGTATELIS